MSKGTRTDKSISRMGNRESFTDPEINPTHWVNKWERGEVASDEDKVTAARAIKRSGAHIANNRYQSFVNEHLGGI